MVKQEVIFSDIGKLKVETYSKDPDLVDDQVLIEISYTGICGSDYHWLTQGSLGHFPLRKGAVYGHESSGVVKQIGPKVKHLKVGDRVCMEPNLPDWTCNLCRKGTNNLCLYADPGDQPGFFRTTVNWPEVICHKLPDSVSDKEGAIVEPLACAIWGIKRSRLEGGETAVVFGCGPMGLLTTMVLKNYGVNKVLAIDLNPKRLKVATEAGADFVIQSAPGEDETALAERIVQVMGAEPNITLDCSGAAIGINTGIVATRRGGKVVLVGLGHPKVNVMLSTASLKEIDIISVARYNNTFPEAISLISARKVDVSQLISHILDLEQAQQGFDLIKAGEAVKVLLRCNK